MMSEIKENTQVKSSPAPSTSTSNAVLKECGEKKKTVSPRKYHHIRDKGQQKVSPWIKGKSGGSNGKVVKSPPSNDNRTQKGKSGGSNGKVMKSPPSNDNRAKKGIASDGKVVKPVSAAASGRRKFGFRNKEKSTQRNDGSIESLKKLLHAPPYEIILILTSKESNLLNKANLSVEKMMIIIEILKKASVSQLSPQNMSRICSNAINGAFLNEMRNFVPKLRKHLTSEEINECLVNLMLFLTACCKTVNLRGIEKLILLIRFILPILPTVTINGHKIINKEVIKHYENLLVLCENKHRLGENANLRFPTRLLDEVLPGFGATAISTNFRDIPVIPTMDDILTEERPLLKKNLIDAPYEDVESYLDIQFRLLREDFIRPLREGIQMFKKDNNAKLNDVKIYQNVKILTKSEIHRGRIIHFMKLDVPRNFAFFSSKRLLHGNVLCLSHDNFKTFSVCFISDSSEQNLRNGLVGITFLGDKLCRNKLYSAAESSSFFIAYKTVLETIQTLNRDNFPLAEHIVYGLNEIDLPEYASKENCVYDLSVIENISTMKKTVRGVSEKIFGRCPIIIPEDGNPRLEKVNIKEPLECWPKSEIFKLDESQRRALHASLTRKLVIIQGPPGTGKTFLGLKIAQSLLNNSQYWSNGSSQPPILVVCYTNHALDQFLEGMLKFTSKVVRFGSRSKSESIQEYQINNLVSKLRKERLFPWHIHSSIKEINDELSGIEYEYKVCQNKIGMLNTVEGILKLGLFVSNNAIPSCYQDQMMNEEFFCNWLMNAYGGPFAHQHNEFLEEHSETVQSESNDCEISYAMELKSRHQAERIMDFDDYEHVRPQRKFRGNTNDYILTSEQCYEAMKYSHGISAEQEHFFMMVIQYHLQFLKDVWMWSKLWRRLRPLYPSENLHNLPFEERCMLYGKFKEELKVNLTTKLSDIEKSYNANLAERDELSLARFMYVSQHADVVGMTTTGASKFRSLIQDLGPKIVIVEEAAEVLEAHIIASVPSTCEHLIMIGDHQQLKPSTTVYELATKYHLDTSLFERMVNNDIPFETLEFQHRMRPEISDLLVPTIYPSLKNHASVYDRPDIRGMAKNVFFLKHEHMEVMRRDGNNSHSNQFEAELIVLLARHLVLQEEYPPEKITILTPYSGQFLLLKKEMSKHKECIRVQIVVVDSFQGEENDIILLSLVRSNERSNVGFLKIENRVCVALSRARFGMFIVGNMNQLCSANPALWPKINRSLEKQGAVGETLTLKCPNHPSVCHDVNCGSDILSKSPLGGCLLKCDGVFPKCGHSCPEICHAFDSAHVELNCMRPCENKCSSDHQCNKLCYQECKCSVLVRKSFPTCDHTVVTECSNNICPEKCGTLQNCGHKCERICHPKTDQEHANPCISIVEKTAACGHKFKLQCAKELNSNIKCLRTCLKTLECGHPCKRSCSSPCGECQEIVTKIIPECGHSAKIRCSDEPRKQLCDHAVCSTVLTCGHQCDKTCRERCTQECTRLVISPFTCPKKHQIQLPCHLSKAIAKAEDAWPYCSAACDSTNDCGHGCLGTCGKCLQGRVHVLCTLMCERDLVCGHRCKSPCSAACPPCQAKCQWRCKHSKCNKTCGIMCTPCNELCEPSCEHKEPCGKKCGEICDCEPCDEPCPEKLPCGHDCLGFCGDPCFSVCRICSEETDLPDVVRINRDEGSRFVLLGCCDLVEPKVLEEEKNSDSLVKRCPDVDCRQPFCTIYPFRRLKNHVLQGYEHVQAALAMHYEGAPSFSSIAERMTEESKLSVDIPQLVSMMETMSLLNNNVRKSNVQIQEKFLDFKRQVPKCGLFHQLKLYISALQRSFQNKRDQKTVEPVLSAGKLHLYDFQARVMERAIEMRKELTCSSLHKELTTLVIRVLQLDDTTIPVSFAFDVSCELDRIEMRSILQKVTLTDKDDVELVEMMLAPTEKFIPDFSECVADTVKEYSKFEWSYFNTSPTLNTLKTCSMDEKAWCKCYSGAHVIGAPASLLKIGYCAHQLRKHCPKCPPREDE